jgi:hypothetical protein
MTSSWIADSFKMGIGSSETKFASFLIAESSATPILVSY